MQKRKLVAIVLALAMILSTFGTLPTFAAAPLDCTYYTVTADKDFIPTGAASTVKISVKYGDGTSAGLAANDQSLKWVVYNPDGTTQSSGTMSDGVKNIPIIATVDSDKAYTVAVGFNGAAPAALAALAANKNYVAVYGKDNMTISSVSSAYGEATLITGTVKDGTDVKLDPAPAKIYLFMGAKFNNDDKDMVTDYASMSSFTVSSNGTFYIAADFSDATDWAIGLKDPKAAPVGPAINYYNGTVPAEDSLDVEVDKDSVTANPTQADTIKVHVEDEDGNDKAGAVVVVTDVQVATKTIDAPWTAAIDTYDVADATINGYVVGDVVTSGVPAAFDAAKAIARFSKKDVLYGVTNVTGDVTFSAKFAKSGKAKVTVYYEDPLDNGAVGATPVIADVAAMGNAVGAVTFTDGRDAIDDGAWDYTGDCTFDVTTSASVNASVVVGPADMDMVDVGTGRTYAIDVNVWDSEGHGIAGAAAAADHEGLKNIEVSLTGAGFDETADETDANFTSGGAAGADKISWAAMVPKFGGIVTAKITVTYKDGVKETITKTVEVDGWQVTVTPTALGLDTETNLKVVVTDADGKPVNSAKVYVEHRNPAIKQGLDAVTNLEYLDDGKWKTLAAANALVDGGSDNIDAGTYAASVKFGDAEKIAVCVYNQANELKAFKNLEVYGDAVYTLAIDPATVIVLNGEDVDITAKDADGSYIQADTAFVTIDGDDYTIAGGKLSRDGKTYTVDGAAIDANIDEAGTYDVYFRNADRTELGKTTITFVKPTVDLGVTALTDSVKEDLTVKAVDPRDNSVLDDAQVRITVEGSLAKVYENGSSTVKKSLPADGKYEAAIGDSALDLQVMAWDDDANDIDDPIVIVKVCLNGADWTTVAELPVKAAEIIASPNKIAVDAQNVVTITAKDANGKALDAREIVLSGAVNAESETDENGSVTFMLKPVASGTIYAKVKTDRKDAGNDPVYAEGKFQAVFGSAAGGTGLVKIELMVGRTDAVANGKVATLDVAPFIENGRTLMPFRFIGEALGAKVEWIAAGNKVTFTSADGKIVIELVIGSADAKVNGVAKKLDVPAKVVNGRTVVPVRFVSENMGCFVDWNFATNAITITK